MARPLIIDAHLHVGRVSNFHSSGATAEELLGSMDRLGITSGCVSSMDAIGPDVPRGNQEIAELAARYPERIHGMLCVNPHFPAEVEAQLALHMPGGHFKQFKLHPFLHGVQSDDAGYRPVYSYAEHHRLSILIHTWGVHDVNVFTSVAAQYPGAWFIMGHSGGDIPGIQAAAAAAKTYPNIILDITSTWNYDGAIEYMVEQVGAERVLFGSDAVFNSQSAALGRVLHARLRASDKELILGLNMQRILDERRLTHAADPAY